MERQWSADSLSSPLLEKPAYVATFDANRPKPQRRRSSVPAGPVTGSTSATDPSGDGTRERKRFREQHRLSGSQSNGKAFSTSVAKGKNKGAQGKGRRPRLGPRSSTDTIYAAGSSGRDHEDESFDASSGSDVGETDTDKFQWDVVGRRTSAPTTKPQGLRSYLASSSSSPRSTPPVGSRRAEGSVPRQSTWLSSRSNDKADSARAQADISLQRTPKANGHALTEAAGVGSLPGHNTALAKSMQSADPSPKSCKSFNSIAEAFLLCTVGFWACWQLYEGPEPKIRQKAYELGALILLSLVYYAFSRQPGRIWSADLRAFRDSGDDGALNGLLMGPLVASTMLLLSLKEGLSVKPKQRSPNGDPVPDPLWLIEDPLPILGNISQKRLQKSTSLTALSEARCTLLSLQTLTGLVFLAHLIATKRQWTAYPPSKSAWKRLQSYVGFSFLVTSGLIAMRDIFAAFGVPLWTDLDRWEVTTASLLFQNNAYAISRLGRRSFTLAELGIVAALGVTLGMETINLTVAKMFPDSYMLLKTFRSSTPLLVFQLALIVGTFMAGFLLSPLLYLSRNLAQKPVHRLRWPHKRDLHRRLLSGFFFVFAVLFVAGPLGLWVGWLLGRRNPWVWAAMYTVQGRHWWTRPALMLYWVLLIFSSVIGWQAVVWKAKKFRVAKPVSEAALNTQTGPPPPSPRPRAWDIVSSNGLTVSTVSRSDGSLSKAKRPTQLSLNARRKFFHVLAVILFTPAIAIDPAFTHLAFSLAFSIFAFAEYIRYFALYPFGANLHIFMCEFTDHKDSGPVILSHFYLLSGCSGALWLDSHSQITNHTGVLILGVGDALASVIGRKYGRVHWPTSSKTIEGSLAFLCSVIAAAWALRLVGWTEQFDMLKYSGVVVLLTLMEGVSEQNDNLILPIYGFVCLSLAKV